MSPGPPCCTRSPGLPGGIACTPQRWWMLAGKLPLVLTFVDSDEHVQRVLPTLRQMAAHRLIVRENVQIEQGLD